MIFKPGQMIRFTYTHQARDEHTGDKFKEILVLHPKWQNKVHGVDLKKLSPAERKVLELVLDPEQKDVPSRIPLVNNIKSRMDPIKDIHSPITFYTKFVKPFLNGKDAYRTYIPHNMTAVTVLKDYSIATGKKVNQNPLFGQKPGEHKPNDPNQPPETAQPPKGLTPIDIMANASKNKGHL